MRDTCRELDQSSPGLSIIEFEGFIWSKIHIFACYALFDFLVSFTMLVFDTSGQWAHLFCLLQQTPQVTIENIQEIYESFCFLIKETLFDEKTKGACISCVYFISQRFWKQVYIHIHIPSLQCTCRQLQASHEIITLSLNRVILFLLAQVKVVQSICIKHIWSIILFLPCDCSFEEGSKRTAR